LLNAQVDALVNTVNTVGVMGRGVALQFKQAFPDNYAAYKRACDRGEVVPGRMFIFDTNRMGPQRYIINFPTKRHWKGKSRLSDIKDGLRDLVRVIHEYEIRSVALPALGCGNGGLDWEIVRPLIEHAFVELPGVEVLLFPPAGAPPADQMLVATKKPAMTRGRAATIGLLQRYLVAGASQRFEVNAAEQQAGVSLLEIQKLLYLLQVAGEDLRLAYGKGRYGPYAETVNKVLEAMEGHYIRGYGDRSQAVLELAPIALIESGVNEAEEWISHERPLLRDRFDSVLNLINGLESPYGLELLATVHWAATVVDRAAAQDEDRAIQIVREWSARKARIFTPKHVRYAWGRLRDAGWLPTA
jgi:O-acetyl-ADP-ribose deacetylase (regulator of RNase III)